NLISLVDSYMREIAGIREATMGEAPSARMSGVGMETLISQDTSRLGPVREEYSEILAEEWALILSLTQRFADPNELLRISGVNRATAIALFRSASVLDQVDVRVVSDGRMPDGPEARAQVLTQLANAGFLDPVNDPHDKQLGLSLMDLGDEFVMLEEQKNADLLKAKRENILMKSGLYARPEEVDNHLVHLVEHAGFIKTQQFDDLDLGTQQVVRAHTEWHLQQILMGMQMGLQLPGGMAVPPDLGAGTPVDGGMSKQVPGQQAPGGQPVPMTAGA
ncbi:MAG TPA: hypothetical protein VM285_17030, partial [Polyangia bacterium]|nr:hypothetical protein [Polyangia bacterium]